MDRSIQYDKVSRHNKNPTSKAYFCTYLPLCWDFTINVSLRGTMMPNHQCAVSIYIDLSFSSHLHYVIKNVEGWESLSKAFYLCVNTPCQQQWPPKILHSTSHMFKVKVWMLSTLEKNAVCKTILGTEKFSQVQQLKTLFLTQDFTLDFSKVVEKSILCDWKLGFLNHENILHLKQDLQLF